MLVLQRLIYFVFFSKVVLFKSHRLVLANGLHSYSTVPWLCTKNTFPYGSVGACFMNICRTVQVDRIQENMASTFELTNSHMERTLV